MRLMAGGTNPDFIKGIYLVLREYFVGSVAIPAIRCGRFRSLEHLGVPASGYFFSLFLMAAFALRPGQTSGMRECLHVYVALVAGQLGMYAPGDLVSVDEEVCRVLPFLQSGLRRHDHCFAFLPGDCGNVLLAMAIQAALGKLFI